jgi:hypothetical protein
MGDERAGQDNNRKRTKERPLLQRTQVPSQRPSETSPPLRPCHGREPTSIDLQRTRMLRSNVCSALGKQCLIVDFPWRDVSSNDLEDASPCCAQSFRLSVS